MSPLSAVQSGGSGALRMVLSGTAVVGVSFGLARYGYGLMLPSLRRDLQLDRTELGIVGSGAYLSYLLATASSARVLVAVGWRGTVAVAGVLATAGMLLVAAATGPTGGRHLHRRSRPGAGLAALPRRCRAARATRPAGHRARPGELGHGLRCRGRRARRSARRRALAAGLVPVTRHRLEGLREAWQDTGGSWSDVRVAICSRDAAGQGAQLTGELLRSHPHLDALAAMSDELALGALQSTTRAGVTVPDDLAVTGWDDTPAADTAGLTTVRQDLRSQGELCARIALDAPDPTGGEDDRQTADWEVIRRASTRTRH